MKIHEITKQIKDARQKKEFEILSGLLSIKKETSKQIEIVFFKEHKDKFLEYAQKYKISHGFDKSQHFFLEFVFKNKKIRIRTTGKDPFNVKNSNSLGKELANAAEIATIQSLTNDIKTPSDTKQKIFIENPQLFEAWKNTFIQTKKAVIKIAGKIEHFDIIHDATDKSNFSKLISEIVRKGKPYITSKDSWCPADIFLIKKTSRALFEKELSNILDVFDGKNLLINVNQLILKYYNENVFYPISLKQITANEPKISYENSKQQNVPTYDIGISNLTCDLSMDTKEIGNFAFINNATNGIIRMQVRGFPHGYTTAQMEITSDGSKTGGRIGKVPTNIIDSCMAEYNDNRISSIKYFGTTPFGGFDDKKIKEVYSWFETVEKFKFVKIIKKISFEEFKDLVAKAQYDNDIAAKLAIKIQGLKILRFFALNNKDISKILTKLINGGKKIGEYNAFFIKIY